MKKKSMEVGLYRDYSMHRSRAKSCAFIREITRSPSRTENGRNWDAVEFGGSKGERFPRWRKSHSGKYNCEQLPTRAHAVYRHWYDIGVFASCQGRSLIRVKTDIERLSLDRLFSSYGFLGPCSPRARAAKDKVVSAPAKFVIFCERAEKKGNAR